MYNNEYLIHYGREGMKWGQHIFQNSNNNLRKAHNDANYQKKQDAKNRRILSTSELRDKIERLKMEKQLRELTEEELYPGRKAAKQILGQIGQKVITTAAAGAALYGIKSAASGKFDMKEFGSAMFNGGAKKK